MSEYKDAITSAMTMLGENGVLFCGYNVRYGKAGGTMNGVPEEQLIEFPLAENLMAGASIGLSLDGNIVLIYFERMDFVLLALDAICNHLNRIAELSDGLHRPACIIRCVVGNSSKPLFTGATHVQNYAPAIREMVDFPVIELFDHDNALSTIEMQYRHALGRAREGVSTLLTEFKDSY